MGPSFLTVACFREDCQEGDSTDNNFRTHSPPHRRTPLTRPGQPAFPPEMSHTRASMYVTPRRLLSELSSRGQWPTCPDRFRRGAAEPCTTSKELTGAASEGSIRRSLSEVQIGTTPATPVRSSADPYGCGPVKSLSGRGSFPRPPAKRLLLCNRTYVLTARANVHDFPLHCAARPTNRDKEWFPCVRRMLDEEFTFPIWPVINH
jgi:hypothetical protein